jgi:cell division septal protein FtsQ
VSTAVLDERDQRRASVRAQAAAIADAPRPPRRFSVPPGIRLRSSPRLRSHTRAKPKPTPRARAASPRRLIVAAVLAVQLALLALALTMPAFKVHTVAIGGTRLVAQGSVRDTAAIPQQSIFTVDADAIRARVRALPWVQDATVTTELPDTVRIAVTERTPAVRVRRANSDVFVADNGAMMTATQDSPALWTKTPVLLDERAGSTQPVDPALLRILAITAQRFPAVFGGSVAAYQWGVDDVFSIWTNTGWKLVLGHLDTADALAQVPAQLAALGALRGQLDFAHPTFGYIDVENAAAPAVAGKPGLPAEVTAASDPLPAPADSTTVASASPNALPHRQRATVSPAPVTATST